MMRRYSELIQFATLRERYEYLKLSGQVGCVTFGSNRFRNQGFYSSYEWRQTRRHIILRDNGCDLGVEGYEIHRGPVVHHINPVTIDDLLRGSRVLFDPENLITVSHSTHNAIHYADASLLPQEYVERTEGDHLGWRPISESTFPGFRR